MDITGLRRKRLQNAMQAVYSRFEVSEYVTRYAHNKNQRVLDVAFAQFVFDDFGIRIQANDPISH